MELQPIVLLFLFLHTTLVYCLQQYDIYEEGGANEYIGNIPQDLHLAPLSQGDPRRRYQILNGGDLVKILKNGDLMTKVRLDRETICSDNPRECVVDIEIGVTQIGFDLIKVQLLLLDVNDEVPTFPKSQIEKKISESAAVGTAIRLDSAVDPDLNAHSIQRYEISSLSPSELDRDRVSVPFFDLNVLENVDGTKVPELRLREKLDREQISSYKLLLYAIDGGAPEQTGTATVLITVLDSNDNEPVFTQSNYDVTVPESVERGYVVVQVEATDGDQGANAEIEFSFPSVVGDQDRAIFDLDRTTGVISLKSKLDFENKTIHHLSVEARDGAANPASTYATVTVRVEDVNDDPPHIGVKFMEDVIVKGAKERGLNMEMIRENIPIGSILAFVTITDKDTGINGNVSCRLRDTSAFKMRSVGRRLNRYLIETAKDLDRETERLHDLEIEAWDYGSPPLTSTKTIVIGLVDENDNAPKFAKSRYSLSVGEGVRPGDEIATLTADDADAGDNAEITYASAPFGSDYVPFGIRADTGAVFFKEGAAELDAENKTETFVLNVTATDNGDPRLSTSTLLVITVADENDNAPKFSNLNYVFRLDEDASTGLYVNAVSAHDADVDRNTNGKVRYSFERPTSVFSINADTGEIHFVGNSHDLDREARSAQPYNLVVKASDRGEPQQSDHCTVEIYIVDINDNPPVITSPNVTKDLSFVFIKSKHHVPQGMLRAQRKRNKRAANGTFNISRKKKKFLESLLIGSEPSKLRVPKSVPVLVARIQASDPDEGENGRVRFTLAGGNTFNYFAVDGQSGNVTLRVNSERELRKMKRGCHVIKINVKDLGKPIQQSFGWVNIFVSYDDPKTINVTDAMKDCMNNSFYPKQFLPQDKNVNAAGLNLFMIIIISISAVVLLLIICIVIVVLVKCKRNCAHKQSRSYSCNNSELYAEARARSKGSLHHTGNGTIDSRTAALVDWSAAAEKEGMMMMRVDASDGSERSHNSAKDSGTGDSMPSDAYHTTVVGAAGYLRPQYSNFARYQPGYGQPSHVYLPPQDDVLPATDEERRQGYPSFHINTKGIISAKCTSECLQFGHSDQCWMPEPLHHRPSTRMTSLQQGEEFESDSLKYSKRAKTPNSIQHLDDGRYVAQYYYDPGSKFDNNGQVARGNFSPHPDEVVAMDRDGLVHFHHYQGQPYENIQHPVTFTGSSPVSYHSSPHGRKAYVNIQGNGVMKGEDHNNIPADGGKPQYENYPVSGYAQQDYSSSQDPSLGNQQQAFQTYDDVHNQKHYYEQSMQDYDRQAAYGNEFAATNLMLSPADSEPPSGYEQRHDRQNPRGYESSSDTESQRLLKSEGAAGSIPSEDDPSAVKLSTIREEMDADEVVAGIERLLL